MAKFRNKKKYDIVASPAAPVAAAPREPAMAARPDWQRELLFVLPALLLAVFVYANTLDGAFVYDDTRQIVRNGLIQDGSQFFRAIFSDVWAFKGGAVAASNYWRPTFVFWLILNVRFFGLEDTTGWHVTNILLHVVVVALGYALARRMDVSRWVASAIAILFAVHPGHVESVAWISGSPDLLLSVALLGSLWCVLSLAERATPARWAGALGLYAAALGAKEIAIFFPLVVVAALWMGRWNREEKGLPIGRALRIAAPFAGLAVVYFFARLAILGNVTQEYQGGAGLGGAILTAPAAFIFYLRQIVFPYWIGPSYPLRAVTASTIGLTNFVLPLAGSVAVVAGILWLATRSKVARLGAALFLLPLIPAMNTGAFQPEQLVHDRYLYLPLYGVLLLTLPLLADVIERFGLTAERARQTVLVAAAVCAIPLCAQTIVYNRAWLSDLALWQRGVVSDPTSAFNHMQLGAALIAVERFDEAAVVLDKSIAINPSPNAYVARARAAIAQKRFKDAEVDLVSMINGQSQNPVDAYTLFQGYQMLAMCCERQGKFEQAAVALNSGRANLRLYGAALTEQLAVVYYQSGKKQEALAELEAYRAAARVELLPESKQVFFRLGLLYTELGRTADARAAYQEFLSATTSLTDPLTRNTRGQANAALRSLSP